MTMASLELERSGLLPATSLAEAKENAEIYAVKYEHVARMLKGTQHGYQDVQFFATLAGIGFGIAEEIDWAIGAAALAGGTDVVQQRYNLTVQQANYSRASDAFYCIHDLLYATDLEELSREGLQRFNKATTTLKQKLEKAQYDIDLAVPDTSSLEQSIRSHIDATKAVKGFSSTQSQQNFINKDGLSATEAQAQAKQLQDSLIEDQLLTAIESCVAQF